MVVEDRMVREPERAAITGVGRSAWYVLEVDGLAPKRRVIQANRVGWLLSELVDWCRARPVGRPEPPEAALRARGVDRAR